MSFLRVVVMGDTMWGLMSLAASGGGVMAFSGLLTCGVTLPHTGRVPIGVASVCEAFTESPTTRLAPSPQDPTDRTFQNIASPLGFLAY